VVNGVMVKRRAQTRHVRIRETNANEALMTHRNIILDDIKTGDACHLREERGGYLLTGCAMSGVQEP
jgi:hypothetical protein